MMNQGKPLFLAFFVVSQGSWLLPLLPNLTGSAVVNTVKEPNNRTFFGNKPDVSLGKQLARPVLKQGEELMRPVQRQEEQLVRPVHKQEEQLVRPVHKQEDQLVGSVQRSEKPKPQRMDLTKSHNECKLRHRKLKRQDPNQIRMVFEKNYEKDPPYTLHDLWEWLS